MSTPTEEHSEKRSNAGEVLISGLDTGPTLEERQNISPTQELMELSPETDQKEPEDEDG